MGCRDRRRCCSSGRVGQESQGSELPSQELLFESFSCRAVWRSGGTILGEFGRSTLREAGEKGDRVVVPWIAEAGGEGREKLSLLENSSSIHTVCMCCAGPGRWSCGGI